MRSRASWYVLQLDLALVLINGLVCTLACLSSTTHRLRTDSTVRTMPLSLSLFHHAPCAHDANADPADIPIVDAAIGHVANATDVVRFPLCTSLITDTNVPPACSCSTTRTREELSSACCSVVRMCVCGADARCA